MSTQEIIVAHPTLLQRTRSAVNRRTELAAQRLREAVQFSVKTTCLVPAIILVGMFKAGYGLGVGGLAGMEAGIEEFVDRGWDFVAGELQSVTSELHALTTYQAAEGGQDLVYTDTAGLEQFLPPAPELV